MTKLENLAQAIKKIEGWYAIGQGAFASGSLTYRHHNPGALRKGKGQVGTNNNFAVFEDDNAGMAALLWDLKQKCLGNTVTGLNGESTLADFAKKWAPASDGNDPDGYVGKIEYFTKFPRTMKLKELLTE